MATERGVGLVAGACTELIGIIDPVLVQLKQLAAHEEDRRDRAERMGQFKIVAMLKPGVDEASRAIAQLGQLTADLADLRRVADIAIDAPTAGEAVRATETLSKEVEILRHWPEKALGALRNLEHRLGRVVEGFNPRRVYTAIESLK